MFLETNLILLAEASRISVCYAIVKYFSVIAGVYIIRIQYYSIIYNMYMVEGEEEFYNFFVSPTLGGGFLSHHTGSSR